MSDLFEERFEQEAGLQPEEQELSPQMIEQVQGLLQLGELHDQFEFLGHEFHIRTMRIGEELAALALIKEFQEVPLAQGRAYATAMVAGALESVDGLPLAAALTPGKVSVVAAKYNKVNKWYFYIIDYIYKRYLELEKKQAETLEELQQRLSPNENSGTEELPADDS